MLDNYQSVSLGNLEGNFLADLYSEIFRLNLFLGGIFNFLWFEFGHFLKVF